MYVVLYFQGKEKKQAAGPRGCWMSQEVILYEELLLTPLLHGRLLHMQNVCAVDVGTLKCC